MEDVAGQDSESIEALRRKIHAGIEEADRGEMEDVDDDITERIRAAGHLILAAERAIGQS